MNESDAPELRSSEQHEELMQIARDQFDRACDLLEDKHGNRRQNVENAITGFTSALEVLTKKAQPQVWAHGQSYLASAKCENDYNSEEVILHYQKALELWTKDKNPDDWAATHCDLAIKLPASVVRERKQNIEDIIGHFRCALEVWTESDASDDWARTQMNLGNTMAQRIEGERLQNLEDAITHYNNAMKVWTRSVDSHQWANVQLNLAGATAERLTGEQTQNIDDAIKHYHNCLEVWTEADSPCEWTRAQANLADTLSQKTTGNRVQNVEDAIEHFHNALRVWTKDSDPHDWANLQMNLACALVRRFYGRSMQNFTDAIKHLHRALEVWTEVTAPYDCSLASLNLCAIYLSRARLLPAGTITQQPPVGAVLENVASEAALEEAETRQSDLDSALKYSKFPQKYFSMKSDPLNFLRLHRIRGDIHFLLGEVGTAIQTVEVALNALEYAQSLSSAGLVHSRSLAEENGILYDRKIWLHLFNDEVDKAFEACEKGKAALLNAMIYEGVDIQNLSESEQRAYKVAVSDLRSLKHKLDCAVGSRRHEFEDLEKTYVRRKTEVDDLRKKSTTNEHIYELLSAPTLRNFAMKENVMAIVFFFNYRYNEATLKRSGGRVLHAFCVWKNEIHIRVAEHIEDPATRYLRDSFCKVDRHRRVEDEYIVQIGSFISDLFNDNDIGSGHAPERLVVVPHRTMHKIPFHAMPITLKSSDGTDVSSEMTLGDIVSGGLWTVPTLSIASSLHGKAVRNETMNDSDIVSVTCASLPICDLLGDVVPLACEELSRNLVEVNGISATADVVRRSTAVRECDILHFNCHGSFAGDVEMDRVVSIPSEVISCTGLYIGYEKNTEVRSLLSMTDIWNMRLCNCRLAVVVACSGAVVNTASNSDECLSIGTAFLVGGARHVVCTLWLVDDIAALMVISQFYRNLCAGMEKTMARCLAEAQSWYRDLSPAEYKDALEAEGVEGFEKFPDNRDFYNWAAFTIIGPPETERAGRTPSDL